MTAETRLPEPVGSPEQGPVAVDHAAADADGVDWRVGRLLELKIRRTQTTPSIAFTAPWLRDPARAVLAILMTAASAVNDSIAYGWIRAW